MRAHAAHCPTVVSILIDRLGIRRRKISTVPAFHLHMQSIIGPSLFCITAICMLPVCVMLLPPARLLTAVRNNHIVVSVGSVLFAEDPWRFEFVRYYLSQLRRCLNQAQALRKIALRFPLLLPARISTRHLLSVNLLLRHQCSHLLSPVCHLSPFHVQLPGSLSHSF